MSKVNYQGMWHFMRTKKWVTQAADLVASRPSAPPAVQIAPALQGFIAHTPGMSPSDAQTYFLALVTTLLAERGQRSDSLGMYMLDQALSALAQQRGRRPAGSS